MGAQMPCIHFHHSMATALHAGSGQGALTRADASELEPMPSCKTLVRSSWSALSKLGAGPSGWRMQSGSGIRISLHKCSIRRWQCTGFWPTSDVDLRYRYVEVGIRKWWRRTRIVGDLDAVYVQRRRIVARDAELVRRVDRVWGRDCACNKMMHVTTDYESTKRMLSLIALLTVEHKRPLTTAAPRTSDQLLGYC